MWACFRFRACEEFQRGRVISIQGRGRAKKRHAIISLLQHGWTVSDINYNHRKLIFCALFWISDRLALKAKLQKQDSCGVGEGKVTPPGCPTWRYLTGQQFFALRFWGKQRQNAPLLPFTGYPAICKPAMMHKAREYLILAQYSYHWFLLKERFWEVLTIKWPLSYKQFKLMPTHAIKSSCFIYMYFTKESERSL